MTLASMDFYALGLFAVSVAVLTATLVLLSGFLPLGSRPASERGALRLVLLALSAAAAAALAACTLRFALGALSLAPAVIAGGLALLAGPLLFQALPSGWRNGSAGLFVALLVAGALAVLLDQAARS